MSEKEMQEIISQLFETLKSNSLTIDELLHTNVLKGEDYVELNQGRKASLSDIKSYIARSEENCIDVLKKKDERIPSDNNVFSSIRTLLELANNNELLKKMFLRKDQSDFTRFLLMLLAGAQFGDFIPGIAGAIIDQFGDGEMGSLVLRKFLSVPELRFNRAVVYKGKQIISPGGGCLIESYTRNGDGTWTIVPKLEEGEPLSQETDDIMLAYWHDKDVTTGAFKGFREMKFRVVSVDSDAKTFVIAPKPDSLSVPAIAMTLAQVGNFTNKERQTYTMIDSTLGNNNITFFDDCNTWDIEEHQEKSWFGKKKGRTVAGIDASVYSAVLKHVIMTGLIFQIDEISGDLVRVPCDKGAYIPEKRYAYYDRVSYAGVLWLCVNEKGTSKTPADGNEDWLKQVDKGADGKPGADGIPGVPGADGVTYYTWMRYADDAQGNGMSNNPADKLYMGLAYNKTTATEGSNPADYSWSRFRGEDGTDGIPGSPGSDGKTYYTWIAYSDYSDGRDLYQIPKDSTLYVGIAVNKPTAAESSNPADYTWSRFRGTDGKPGADGIPGIPGADGVTYYTWMRYADDAQGNGMSNNPIGKSYMGLAYNKLTAVESSNPADYTWSRFRGEDGKDGTDGIGIPGADGITYYTWLAYSDNADGSNMYQIPTDNTLYVGIAINKPTAAESSNPDDYTWSRFRGADGRPGTSITNHGAWRTAKTPIPKMGLVTMGGNSWLAKVETSNPPMWCLTDGAGNRLMSGSGYLLTGEINSEEWELIVESGADGKPGADGIPGIPGADGVTYYTWMRYADDAQGNGMSNNPIGKSYMGLAYNKLTAVESSNPADYTWSRFRGEDGKDGTDGIGIPGADGITYYTWLAYSDNADGSNMYQIPTDNTLYVGIAINKPTAAESSNPADYTWSRFRGTDGRPGTSITNHGAWRTAKTPIPKMGLVTMGGNSWLAKVETSNPPMWCLTDGAGNRLMSGSGYLLTGEINSEEWELIVESGVDGKPGADGSDSTSYWLTSPVSTININSVGSLSPSSVLISCKKKKGEGTVTACSDLYLTARKYNGSWLAHVLPVKASSISVNAVGGYTQFTVRAYNSESEANSWSSGFVSEIGVGVVVDGPAGKDGPAGSFPRNRDIFVDGQSYVWNPSYRDSVLYPFDGVYYQFHVANFGATVTKAPTSPSGDGLWESMGKYKSIATDTLFADGANVARFMFKNGVLRSQDETNGAPNLEMDGKTGKFKGVDVELSGKIEAKEDSQIAGMKVVGNSLRGVQAVFGKYKRTITNVNTDQYTIINNIDKQLVYLFQIPDGIMDFRVLLPSAHDLLLKGIEEYSFELTIITHKSNKYTVMLKGNDDASLIFKGEELSVFAMAKGGVMKLFYESNNYYIISESRLLNNSVTG